MGKKIVETVGARPVTFGVAREETRLAVDPHDAALAKLRRIGELAYEKPTVDVLKAINRLALEAGADIRDAKAGRNGR